MLIERLDGQFAISRDFSNHPDGGTAIELPGTAISLYGSARSCRLVAGDGRNVGLLIGSPIDLATGQVAVTPALQAGDPDSIVEELYRRLAGSWLCVFDDGRTRRLYLDANGTKSVVYDRARQLAGATAQTLFPAKDIYDRRLDTGLFRALDIKTDGWFPAGLTAHTGVERLMPNHYLDLDSFATVRHWPIRPITAARDPDAVLLAMCDRIETAIGALATDRPTHIALTAGNETRLLLACCRNVTDRVDFFTANAPGAELDIFRAQDLARHLRLRHQVLTRRLANRIEADAWLGRVGHSLTGANHLAHPSMWPLQGYMVGGSSGEVMRGFLWLNAHADTPLSATNLVDRLKLPRVPQLVERVEDWLARAPKVDTLMLLDLAYIELRMGSWGYAQAYTNPKLEAQQVLVSRANFEAMLSLPVAMRRGDAAIQRAVALRWPELMRYPINRYGDWRDTRRLIGRAVGRPRKVIAKLRQRRSNASR